MNKLYTKSNLGLFIRASAILTVLATLFAFYINHVLHRTLLEYHQLSITPEMIDEIVYKMRLNSAVWVFLYLVLSISLIFAIANRYFVGPMEELRKMSETIENTQGLLVQQEKLASIGHLAAGVAHELNNPIGFVNSNIAALKDYTTELESYIKFLEGKVDRQVLENCSDNDIEFILSDMPELVEESLDGLSRVTSIVKSLKDYARVDLHDRVDYDINEGLVATLTVSRNTYKYIADIHKDLSHVPPLVVNGNQINEVLLNLIVNAAQAIEEKNENEKGCIEVKTYADDTHVYCSIKDNGSGIESAYLGQIFDPFFTTKEPGKGTGLGLNIAYNIIVNKHGGELNVESTVGVGTEFVIKLPLERELEVDEGN